MAAKLTYDPNWYIPTKIKAEIQENRAAVRKEYTRLRDISQKRLKRLKAAGLDDTQAYLRNYKHYPKLKDIKSDSELAARLSDLARFITAKGSTVSGQKDIMKKSLSTLHDTGYTFVNEGNFRDFGKFMEEYRNQMLDMSYDSGDAADLYGVVVKHQLDPEKVKADFEFWLENLDRAEKLRKSKSAGNYEKTKGRIQKQLDEVEKRKKKGKAKKSKKRR
jgi:hypothetical protein